MWDNVGYGCTLSQKGCVRDVSGRNRMLHPGCTFDDSVDKKVLQSCGGDHVEGVGHRLSSPEPFKELLADAVAAAQATKFVEADQTRSLNDFGSWYP